MDKVSKDKQFIVQQDLSAFLAIIFSDFWKSVIISLSIAYLKDYFLNLFKYFACTMFYKW